MKFMIFAQDESIVNISAMQQIYAVQIEDVENESTGEPIFGIIAVPFGVLMEEDEKKLILGMYRTEAECDAAMESLKNSLQQGNATFQMP